MGEVKLLVEIFLSCEKFDYQTFWSRFALGQPEKFDFQTFRRKSQKFAQKVKSLKIKLFSQEQFYHLLTATGKYFLQHQQLLPSRPIVLDANGY